MAGTWAAARGLTRPVLAYVVSITLGVWASYGIEDVKQGGDLLRAPVVAATALLGSGPLLVALLGILMIPALTLSLEVVHRAGATETSRAGRFVVGAASWAGWCLVVAIVLSVGSGVVLVPEVLAGDLFLVAASGGVFALLAFDGYVARPGRALTLLALIVTTFVVIGSLWMAGRWGGAV